MGKTKKDSRLKIIGIILLSVLVVSSAQILMKNGMNSIEAGGIASFLNIYNWVRIFTNPFVIGGLCLYAAALVLWLAAMSQAEVSFMYPLLSVGYVLTTLFAIIFLGEHVALFRWIGLAFIFAGSFFVGKS